MDEKQFNELIAAMDMDEREHFRTVIEMLVQCYTDAKLSAVIVVQEESRMVVIGANVTDWKAADMLSTVMEVLDEKLHSETNEAVH